MQQQQRQRQKEEKAKSTTNNLIGFHRFLIRQWKREEETAREAKGREDEQSERQRQRQTRLVFLG
jgi:hypothetical protein